MLFFTFLLRTFVKKSSSRRRTPWVMWRELSRGVAAPVAAPAKRLERRAAIAETFKLNVEKNVGEFHVKKSRRTSVKMEIHIFNVKVVRT